MRSALVIWMITLTVGICSLILANAARLPEPYMAVCAVIAIVIAALSIKEQRELEAANANQSLRSASTARYMGLVWTWGALALLVTYVFLPNAWREWPTFFAAFAAVAVMCLFFAATLQRDGDKGKDDETMLRLGRYLTIGQLAGTAIAVAGLLIDPNKEFLNPDVKDWAATNVFFFGSIALAAISANALFYARKTG
ncbi:MAG: hypothetical protein NW216_11640 [Hyphomicrobium sp.]|nr:hypothetical protein [Hyphomicrobium sp.]